MNQHLNSGNIQETKRTQAEEEAGGPGGILSGGLEAFEDLAVVEGVAVLGDGDILVAEALLQHTPRVNTGAL